MLDKGGDEVLGDAAEAETPNQEFGAILDVLDGFVDVLVDFRAAGFCGKLAGYDLEDGFVSPNFEH